LPGEYYTSPQIFEAELERIGRTRWHCVGRLDRLALPGSYFLATIARESLIVLRDRRGTLRAHFNLCRHRGTRLCTEPAGRLSETIQCPYHAWTYATDGRLICAPHMQDALGFDPAAFGLHQATVAEWGGFVFVSLDPNPEPFERAFAPLIARLDRFALGRLVVRRRVEYEVRANWKLVFLNYSECLHCPTIHPELSDRVPYQSGANDLVEGPILGGYMEITPGFASVTASGRRAGCPIAALEAADERRGYYYTAMPNFIVTVLPDYVVAYRVWARAPDRTLIESEWLFHPDAESAPDFNPDDAFAIWDLTNRQDWHITEEAQAGISSYRYSPGPYSPRESLLAAWDRAYLESMR
jgi:Rieske 2Fe-2S family protein